MNDCVKTVQYRHESLLNIYEEEEEEDNDE